MTTFTSRNVPLVEGTDPADIAARVNPVAQLQHDRPGVSPLTTTQRNALSGAELWDGRVILNTTGDRIQRWDAGTSTWLSIADASEIQALLATSGTPANVGVTASRGVGTFAARSDHVHAGPDWQVYTPVVTGAATSPAPATSLGRYTQIGKTVHAQFFYSISGAPTGKMTVSLPVSAASSTLGLGSPIHVTGSVVGLRQLNAYHFGWIYLATATTVEFMSTNSATAWNATVPVAWADTDRFRGTVTYEAT